MEIRQVCRALGLLLLLAAGAMLLCLPVSLWFRDGMVRPLLTSVAILGPLGLAVVFAVPRRPGALFAHREAVGTVVFGWVVVSAAGSLPYLLSGAIPSVTDAYFESISGFTTTGSSILTDIEALPPSLLFWRALTHWLGGMGIVLLAVIVLPSFTASGTLLFRAEASEFSHQKLVPRIKENGRILWRIYLAITASIVLLLLLGGLSLFDAITHAFATVATGGFSPKNASVGHFGSAYVEGVIALGMFASGINFTLYYYLFDRRLRLVWRDDALRFYCLTTLASIAAIALYLWRCGVYASWGAAVRYAGFQVVSIHSTTGFATADYEAWGAFPRALLILLMLMGACPGSTCGAIKNLRVLVLLRACRTEIRKVISPRVAVSTRLLQRSLNEGEVARQSLFVGVYLLGVALAGLTVSAFGVDAPTAFSAVVTTMGGVGPGLAQVGPAGNFAGLPAAVKWILGGCMLLGRLEIFAVLAVFQSQFWRAR